MPSWPIEQTSTFVGPTAVTLNVETVFATVTGVGTDQSNRRVRLFGQVNFTTGAGTTSLTLRWRRDSLTGAIVNAAQVDTLASAAGSSEDHSILAVDTPGEIAGATYVCTVQQAAAAANGQWNSSVASATVHN